MRAIDPDRYRNLVARPEAVVEAGCARFAVFAQRTTREILDVALKGIG